jgi:hypothetical protein
MTDTPTPDLYHVGGPPPSATPYIFTATRFQLTLPEPADRVRVVVLTDAFQKLGNEAMHLTLGNVYSGQQDLTGNINVTGLTQTDAFQVDAAAAPGGAPAFFLGNGGNGTLTTLHDFAAVADLIGHWSDDGTTLWPQPTTRNVTVPNLTNSGQFVMSNGPVPGGTPPFFIGSAGNGGQFSYYDWNSVYTALQEWFDTGVNLQPIDAGRGVWSHAGFTSGGGQGLYLEASQVVRLYWDGTYHHNTHSHYSDGDVVAAAQLATYGGNVYFEGSRAVMWRYRGDLGALEAPYGNGIYTTQVHSPGGMYWEAGNTVRTYWDGTYVHSTNNSWSDGTDNANIQQARAHVETNGFHMPTALGAVAELYVLGSNGDGWGRWFPAALLGGGAPPPWETHAGSTGWADTPVNPPFVRTLPLRIPGWDDGTGVLVCPKDGMWALAHLNPMLLRPFGGPDDRDVAYDTRCYVNGAIQSVIAQPGNTVMSDFWDHVGGARLHGCWAFRLAVGDRIEVVVQENRQSNMYWMVYEGPCCIMGQPDA